MNLWSPINDTNRTCMRAAFVGDWLPAPPIPDNDIIFVWFRHRLVVRWQGGTEDRHFLSRWYAAFQRPCPVNLRIVTLLCSYSSLDG